MNQYFIFFLALCGFSANAQNADFETDFDYARCTVISNNIPTTYTQKGKITLFDSAIDVNGFVISTTLINIVEITNVLELHSYAGSSKNVSCVHILYEDGYISKIWVIFNNGTHWTFGEPENF
jgi:hypothetical protein